ncbi:MAG TPA: ferrous iron transport protein B [Dehalococcoidia bacterium]|nr:ferrous iron transport protein B [Dehalococcoidia bacterium]
MKGFTLPELRLSGKRLSLHRRPRNQTISPVSKIAIVGSPNVGKSVVFNRLTGRYAAISNYPGTTVDILRGKARLDGRDYEIVDTPGMYSFNPITEEERVARKILLEEKPESILHVVDAKNLERMLPLTLQLIDAGLPVILQVNMMDEAKNAGIDIDIERLERKLGIPVVPTVAVNGRGMDNLKNTLAAERPASRPIRIKHGDNLESAINRIAGMLKGSYRLSGRAIGLLLLQGDKEIEEQTQQQEGESLAPIIESVKQTRMQYGQPMSYVTNVSWQQQVKQILTGVVQTGIKGKPGFGDRLSQAMMNPVIGSIIFVAVTYLGLYLFVGVFGAGILVDFIEGTIFGQWINPWFNDLVTRFIPWEIARDLFVGDYGIVTLGLTYAFAIIFPIVGTFSIVFAIIEDSGYLPRLAMLIDRVFKLIGLNGRAVIPIILGFGCDTMATIVTRTQETRRERVITTLLLALAIPCSAQLGVIFGILSGNTAALLIWITTIALVFGLTGYLAAQVLPGKKATFYMEVPPLRLPKLSNVASKTLARLEWYFAEVLPMFIVASIVLWIGDFTGVFNHILRAMEPMVEFIGLPGDTAVAFLYGFFRRDFGAAGLYDLHSAGLLNGVPLVVAAVTITLFIPCIAQFLVMIKERGIKTALAIALFVFPFAFMVGFVVNWILTSLGVTL